MKQPSVGGSSGHGVSLMLAFVVFALWLSITKRIERVKHAITDDPGNAPLKPMPGGIGGGWNAPLPSGPIGGTK